MDTKALLHTLAENLEYLHCTAEAKKVLKILKQSNEVNTEGLLEGASAQEISEIDKWVKVLEETQKPIPPQIFERGLSLAIQGATGLIESGEKLRGLSKSELEIAIEIAKNAPGVMNSKGSLDYKRIEKIASEIEKIIADGYSPYNTAKQSQLKSVLGSPAKGSGLLFKMVPYIGPIFSFILALKNLIYGIWELSILLEEVSNIGMSWHDALYADRLLDKANEYNDNPEKLIYVVKATKTSNALVDEGISFVANVLDFFKDIVFFFLESVLAASGIGIGWSVGAMSLDVSLSLVIGLIEWQAEESSALHFRRVLEIVAENAENKIQELTPAPDQGLNYSEMSIEELLSNLSNF